MSTDYKTIPFLDVKHVLNVDSEIKYIKIKSFKKETAIKLTFLNNRSYNPQNIFKRTEKSETPLNIKWKQKRSIEAWKDMHMILF